MTLIFVNKWVTDDFFPTIERALLRQDVCKLCQSFFFEHRLTIGMCIGECTLPRKRRIMRETVARKQKLVRGYEKDLMLLRRTHPGPELTDDWDKSYQNFNIYKEEEKPRVLYSFAEDRDDWSRPACLPVSILKYQIKNLEVMYKKSLIFGKECLEFK